MNIPYFEPIQPVIISKSNYEPGLTLDLSPQKIQDFEHMSNWIWTNTTFISWIWMTCYDSSLSDQDDLRSSEFFCLISATSIVTEEFFRQSQIFTLLNSLLWDGKIPWVPDFPRANKRWYNKRQHALILFKSVNMIFFSIFNFILYLLICNLNKNESVLYFMRRLLIKYVNILLQINKYKHEICTELWPI